jgi:superfamily II DNA or RNA helicase
MSGKYETRGARIQVGTVQTLLARHKRPEVRTVVLDEAHHYVADDWRQLADSYPGTKTVGLTATPERGDGTPLGDLFEELVVAASYSGLIRDRFLVPARVYRPSMNLGNDLAQDPVKAWIAYSEGSPAFVFCARVETALSLAKRFRDAGVQAGTIEAMTPTRDREDTLSAFRRGRLRVITNVNTMTEGVDVPAARTVILARAFGHVGGYLQAVGRVLRPAKDKPDAILIDLTGASIRHGLPTDDREYSLDGCAISEGIGHGGGPSPAFSQDVLDVGLALVAPGALPTGATPEPANVRPVDDGERRAAYAELRASMAAYGMRSSMAAIKFHERFGEWPAKEWSEV